MTRALRSSLALVAVLAIATAAAAQTAPPADPLIKESVTSKVAPHTYVIPDGNVGLVPNVGIIVGTRATLVIDPGLGKRNGEAVAREVAKVSKNTEIYVASTHYHAEHTTGIAAFPTAKYVNASVQDDEQARSGAALIKTFSGRSALTAELLKDAAVRKADITFDRNYTLDLGGVHVRFLVVGPTHTAGDTGFFVEEDGVLFSGDVVMNNSFLAATAVTSMRAWLAAFDAFAALKATVIVPSHGAVGDGSLVAVNRAVMEEVQERARDMKSEGRSADEAVATVQAELVKKHPQWPRANGIAAAVRAAYLEAP